MFGRLLTYMLPIVLQIFIPCYFGEEMTSASERLSTSLFKSEWINESEDFKMLMKIFLENSKRPIRLSAFGVFNVTLDNFLKIINLAYSLFAVMRSVGSK